MEKLETATNVYLIPVPISDNGFGSLSSEVISVTTRVQHFFVENARTARRFLKSLHPELQIANLQFSEIDKHSGPDLQLFRTWVQSGYEIGIMSEAGCPAIADPGADLVALAHQLGAAVRPLVGPTSIVLALMGSGLNGQSFAFEGYLPIKQPSRGKRIKELLLRSAKEQQTQICIETPYRNNQLLKELLQECSPNTRICVATDISGKSEQIKTNTVAVWRLQPPIQEKLPTVFLWLAER